VCGRIFLVEKTKEVVAGMRAALLAICLILVFSSLAGAFEVSSFSIEPNGSTLDICERVTGSFVITSFPAEPGDSLSGGEIFTTLDRPNWSLVLFTDGSEVSRIAVKNQTVFLSSLDFPGSWRTGSQRKIMISFSAWVPDIEDTKNMTIVRVRQTVTSQNGTTSADKFLYSPVVVTCACTRKICYMPEYLLEPLRDDIWEKSRQGIDTSAAEKKYFEARDLLYANDELPSVYYSEKLQNVSRAKGMIADGGRLLDKAWAEKEVADAQTGISNIDKVIEWFRASDTRNDAQLTEIFAKREVAVGYLVTAHDEISNGNYSQAREKAEEAYQKANESYTQALSRTRSVTCCGPDPFLHPFFRAGIAVIILILIGLIWWKKSPEE
jgi:hypothetical protein